MSQKVTWNLLEPKNFMKASLIELWKKFGPKISRLIRTGDKITDLETTKDLSIFDVHIFLC